MSTQVFFRNPDLYIRELVEVGVGKVAWDRGYTHKKRIDPVKHANLYFPDHIPFRVLHVGIQGTAEYRKGDDYGFPCAVYPTWSASTDINLLEEMMAFNIGEDERACNDMRLRPDERPVLGQEHRVVVTDLPLTSTGVGRKLIRQLHDMQIEYPDCILHIHGLYGYRLTFGMGFASADVDVRTSAFKGKVYLPNGKEVTHELTSQTPQWITLLGMSPVDLKVPRNRCIYNIKSAQWAGAHFEEDIKFKSRGFHDPDITSPSALPATTSRVHSGKSVAGDKYLCDTCSLQTSCKYYRSEGVCSIPNSEPAPLATMFKTRSSELIIDGLGTLLATETRRLEKGLEAEDDFGELDPEVTKIIHALFADGVKLAKLVDPALRAGPRVAVNVNSTGPTQVNAGTANRAVAGVVAELEARGIARDKITPAMIEAVLDPERARKAIDATVVAETT